MSREAEDGPEPPEAAAGRVCQKSFAHFDVQSMLFGLNEAAANRASTGPSGGTRLTGLAAGHGGPLTARGPTASWPDPAHQHGGPETARRNLEQDLGDDTSNDLLLSCPHSSQRRLAAQASAT